MRRLGVALAGGAALLNGLFWLAQALSIVMGFIQLLVWDWVGFWQWLLVGLGCGVARFIVIDLIVLPGLRLLDRVGDEDVLGRPVRWRGVIGIACVAFVAIVGFGFVGAPFGGETGSDTDCDALNAWARRSEEWSDQASLPAESVPVNSPYREMHFAREEERMLDLRDDVLESNPPEDAQELGAELMAYFELRAEMMRALSDRDYVARDRLLAEASRSEGRMERMATELGEVCE